jgi:hypothetical protein
VQADSIVPEPGNPQSLNRYSYVLNSPLRYTDPSGHIACLDEECNWVESPVTGKVMWRGSGSPPSSESDWWDSPLEQRPDYYYGSVGVSVPDLVMLGGLGVSLVNPDVGVPIALTGGFLKLTGLEWFDVGGGLIVDRYQNIYFDLQVEVSYPRLPTDISIAAGYGELVDHRGCYVPPTEGELVENLEGPSLEFYIPLGIWGTSLSPGAQVPAAREHGITNSFIGGSFNLTFKLPIEWPFKGFPPYTMPSGFLLFSELDR